MACPVGLPEILDQMVERYNEYLKAEKKVLQSQEYTIEGRNLRNADLRYIQSEIGKLWKDILNLCDIVHGTGRGKAIITQRINVLHDS